MINEIIVMKKHWKMYALTNYMVLYFVIFQLTLSLQVLQMENKKKIKKNTLIIQAGLIFLTAVCESVSSFVSISVYNDECI